MLKVEIFILERREIYERVETPPGVPSEINIPRKFKKQHYQAKKTIRITAVILAPGWLHMLGGMSTDISFCSLHRS